MMPYWGDTRLLQENTANHEQFSSSDRCTWNSAKPPSCQWAESIDEQHLHRAGAESQDLPMPLQRQLPSQEAAVLTTSRVATIQGSGAVITAVQSEGVIMEARVSVPSQSLASGSSGLR